MLSAFGTKICVRVVQNRLQNASLMNPLRLPADSSALMGLYLGAARSIHTMVSYGDNLQGDTS
jgi:hypothetical protein